MFQNDFTYDANGNILRQLRKDEGGATIDDLAYHYKQTSNNQLLQNRLYHVNDGVNPEAFPDDIDDMGSFTNDPLTINTNNNYSYDELGQLIKDKQENIVEIKWRNDGKISQIKRGGNAQKSLVFGYNPSGERISKKIFDENGTWVKTTYYIRDATGNVMATYLNTNGSSETFDLTERYIYGSSRVGVYKEPVSMLATPGNPAFHYVRPGYRQYELSNHLGNVTTTITAQKVPLYSGSTITGFAPQIVKSFDYSPFGVTRVDLDVTARFGGGFGVDDGVRYTFNGQEADNEIKGSGNSINYKYRMYDTRIARFFAVDPIARRYPELSVYQHSSLNPIWKVEIEGLEGAEYRFRQYMKSQGGVQEKAEEYADQMHGEVGKQILRYATPVEDAYGVITGRDFDGQPYNRGEAAAWGAASFIPFAKFAKLAKPVFKVAKGTSRIAGKVGNFASKTLLDEHFIKHGDEFAGKFRNADEYAKGAQDFFKREGDDIFEFARENGEVVKFDKANNIFGVAKDDGTIKTFFKPDDGFDYFKKELGKAQGDDAVKALENSTK